jgi:anti-sigma regulatory factor (Ser/Thr protein kinase)
MTLLSVVSNNPRDLQILVNQAVQYSITHRYKLQPQKSVVIEINKKGRKLTRQKPDHREHMCTYLSTFMEMSFTLSILVEHMFCTKILK